MKNNQKVIIIGGEGTATNIADAIIDSKCRFNSDIEFLGFANDNLYKTQEINGHPILCTIKDLNYYLQNHPDIKVLFSLYKPLFIMERTSLLNSLSIPSEKFFNFVHPQSYISPSVKLGIGNVILSGTSIHSGVVINNFNIFNSNCTIEHDSTIGNNNFFAASCAVGSSVTINNKCFIGINTSIKENLNIPDNSFFGMGSNLLKSPQFSNQIWYGNPAKFIKENNH